MAFPDAWSQEDALVDVTPSGGSAVQIKAAVETIDIDRGDKDVEYMATVGGGRIEKLIPEAETTITFEGYFVELDATSSSGFPLQAFETTDNNYDASEPLLVTSSRNRDKFRVCILFTNDPNAAAASGTTAASTDSFRFTAINCRLVSMKPSFTDGILKFTFKFKVAPFQKSGTTNITEESGDQTAMIAAPTY